MDRATEAWKSANIRSYTSAFQPSAHAPSEHEIENMRILMKELNPMVKDVENLNQKLIKFLPIRESTLRLIAETIVSLNLKYRDVNIAKVAGSSVSLIGDGLIVGGAVAAPLTLGTSLIATAVGGAVCAVGGTTSAGASLVELFISKKKISTIQKAVEKDEALCMEIQSIWQNIAEECSEVSKKHSDKGYTYEDVISVLMVCCIDAIPHKILAKYKAPQEFREKVCGTPKLKECHSECYKKFTLLKETGNHALDVASDIGGGLKSAGDVFKAGGGIVVTALIVKFAAKGSKAVVPCARMAAIPRKVVTVAKVFRVATGANPVVTIALSSVFSFVDVASLIYSAYQIHKKSNSSAATELIRIRDELQHSKNQLVKLKDCLSEIMESV